MHTQQKCCNILHLVIMVWTTLEKQIRFNMCVRMRPSCEYTILPFSSTSCIVFPGATLRSFFACPWSPFSDNQNCLTDLPLNKAPSNPGKVLSNPANKRSIELHRPPSNPQKRFRRIPSNPPAKGSLNAIASNLFSLLNLVSEGFAWQAWPK